MKPAVTHIEIRVLGLSIRILREIPLPPRKPSILTRGVTSQEQSPGVARVAAPSFPFRKSA